VSLIILLFSVLQNQSFKKSLNRLKSGNPQVTAVLKRQKASKELPTCFTAFFFVRCLRKNSQFLKRITITSLEDAVKRTRIFSLFIFFLHAFTPYYFHSCQGFRSWARLRSSPFGFILLLSLSRLKLFLAASFLISLHVLVIISCLGF
jgi:hypothetical protein